jgi:hypothetical protein
MSKKFNVEVPITIRLMVGIEAESEEKAIEKILNEDTIHLNITDENKRLEYIDFEWEMHKQVVQGNVFHGCLNELYVEETE